jgi:hypothetical protein
VQPFHALAQHFEIDTVHISKPKRMAKRLILRRAREPVDHHHRDDDGGQREPHRHRAHRGAHLAVGRRRGAGRARGHRFLLRSTEPFDKACKKIVGDFGGRAVDQSRADLRQLAADLCGGLIVDARPRVVGGKRDARLALGESGRSTLPFEAQRIDVGDDIAQDNALPRSAR